MRRRSLLILVTAFIGSTAFSQVNLQLYGSFVQNLDDDNKGSAFGGGFRVEFGDEDEPFSYYAGLAYNSPIKTTKIIQATAYSGGTNPPTIPVTATYKLSSFRAESGGRYYFVGNISNFTGLNFFANFGTEVFFAFNKPTYSNYDENLYDLGFSGDSEVNKDGTDKIAINIMLAAGFGVEKTVGFAICLPRWLWHTLFSSQGVIFITQPLKSLHPFL